jgi:hypothetical protein
VIEAISAALDLPDDIVHRAAQVSQQLLNDRKHRIFELEEATLPVLMRGPTMNRQKKSAGPIVPYLRLISGYKLNWLIRFGDLFEPEIDLWGAPNDLTAIALKRCRNARLKLETKLRNYAKKTGGYANS